MKNSVSLLIGGLCAVGSFQTFAAAQAESSDLKQFVPPSIEHASKTLKTASFGFATPELIPLDSQIVQSQGASLRPGPHNRHLTPPHGGAVHPGDRGDMPGRS